MDLGKSRVKKLVEGIKDLWDSCSVNYKDIATKRRAYIKELEGFGASDAMILEEEDAVGEYQSNFIKYIEGCKDKLEEAVLYAEKAGEYSTYRKITEKCIDKAVEGRVFKTITQTETSLTIQ